MKEIYFLKRLKKGDGYMNKVCINRYDDYIRSFFFDNVNFWFENVLVVILIEFE